MLDSTEAILSFIKGKRRASLDNNRLLASGVIRELEILGEAAGQISEKTKNLFPKLPWKQLIGMRNRLIHAYFDVDHDIIWKTVKDYLPSFLNDLKNAISELNTSKIK
ncbi:MAG TPA: HepT-like ribonuclease domain-containing protein [Rhabdochlamydiaceae bacterium]|nr:HepT-like ribonuclease domain-containing protein [Rhabdochlamydiaceae bacterium]